MTPPTPRPRPPKTTARRLLTAIFASLAVLLGCTFALPPATAIAATVTVDGLTTNGRVNPLGISGGSPAFGWMSKSDRRNVTQTAYQIKLGSGPTRGDVWVSDMIKT